MAITINGTGTITGISAGGLPDGIVDADMLASDAVNAAKLGTNTFVSYAVICDRKASSADGGTFTSGAWRTRDLNTELFDPDSIVSISSNQFTLGAGTYLIQWAAPGYHVDSHEAKLYDVTNAADVEFGYSAFSYQTGYTNDVSNGSARVTITSNTTYEIQHRCVTTRTTYGFGVGASGYHNWGDTTYTMVHIFKEA